MSHRWLATMPRLIWSDRLQSFSGTPVKYICFLIPGTYNTSNSVKELPLAVVNTIFPTPLTGYSELFAHVTELVAAATTEA